MIAEQMRNSLRELGLDNFTSRAEIEERKEQNLRRTLSRMTDNQKDFWFGGVDVECVRDLQNVKHKLPSDIIEAQMSKPPFGIFTPGPIISTSSGTTTGVKKLYPRSLDDYYRYTFGKVRTLQHYGVNETDVFSSTDTGGMFLAHNGCEDAAVICFGVQRARTYEHNLKKRLEFWGEMGVTVISGTPTKLLRLARLKPRNYMKRQIKLILSVGEKLHDAEEIAEAFGVPRVTDSYGSVEMGNIFWTCPYGHKHVNDDLLDITTQDGVTTFSNVTSLPIFRYVLGETLEFSYKGRCECGSVLPTVDKFVVNGPDRANKVD